MSERRGARTVTIERDDGFFAESDGEAGDRR
jgi:hypothetical protein